MSKPRCEDIGFRHMWDDFGHPLNSRMYIDGGVHPGHIERTCVNCGKVEKWTCIKPAVKAIWDWLEVPPDANS